MHKKDPFKDLDIYGRMGVEALRSATPIDTGTTAASWRYGVKMEANMVTLYWNNDNDVSGVKVAVILQYGHGTGTGGYVVGLDYINPALKPVFDKIIDEVWKKVTNA